MILAFSDGFATTDSRPQDVTGEFKDMGISVYPVVLGHQKIVEQIKHVQQTGYNNQGVMPDGARSRLSRLELQQQEIMDYASLGELTGGRSFDPPMYNMNILRSILGTMAATVLFEYVVGFRPDASDGQPRKHKLSVKLQSKELGKVTGGTRVVVH
jgi:hypothetical protein